MKKLLCALLAAAMISVPAFGAENDIKVLVDGKEIVFDQKPVIEDGRVLVPFRAIFEALECQVTYNDYGGSKTVMAKQGSKVINLTIGEKEYYVDGEMKTLDVPAKIINDRTMVPVRAVSEGLDAKVGWTDSTKTVTIEGEKGQYNIDRKIISKDFLSDDGKNILRFYAAYPVIENKENDSFINDINNHYKAAIEQFYEEVSTEVYKEAKDWYDGFEEYYTPEEIANQIYPLMDMSVDFDVTYNENDGISMTMLFYYNYGGAHPTTERVSKTFDLALGEEITIDDVLIGTKEENEAIVLTAFEDFLEDFRIDAGDYAEVVKKNMLDNIDKVNFYIDKEGIVLYYQVYEVGPYAMGYPEGKIPFAEDYGFELEQKTDEFIIKLDGNPTTGYEWIVKEKTDNIEVESMFASGTPQEGTVGAGGKYFFTVKGLKEGKGKIVLEYKRAWESEAVNEISYEFNVKADGTIELS